MTPTSRMQGLIAATYTPLHDDGRVHLDAVPAYTDWLIDSGVSGLYVCGSTGEGVSLASPARREVAEAFVRAADGRVPVIVQVGHNSLAEASGLAEHAAAIGAAAISATCPSYFKVDDIDVLVDCMANIAAAAEQLPFYYYHIPSLTGSQVDVTQVLARGAGRISNLVGLKYTDTKLFEFQTCLELDRGRFDVVWGCDEMLLGAWATGTTAAIGSTYNIATPLYRRMIDLIDAGQWTDAREHQSRSIAMIQTIGRFPFHPAMKQVLGFLDIPVGPCRLPQRRLDDSEIAQLHKDLQSIGFFRWASN